MQTMCSFTIPRIAVAGIAIAVCGLGASEAVADGVSAGTLIENTATATYDDGGATRTITSNVAVVRVDELLDVTVTSRDAEPILVVPGQAVLTFEVINLGNGPEAYELTTQTNLTDNDFETTFDHIAIDSNGNGTYDPGVDEILTTPQMTPTLAADQAVTVFVIVIVPNDAADQQISQVELTASAVTGSGAPGTVFAGQGEGGGDAIVGTTTASASALGGLRAGITSVILTKSADFLDPFGEADAVPGTVATFTLIAQVVGSSSIDDLMVVDAIPEGTTYVRGSLTLDAASLTDVRGDDAGEASNATGISIALGGATAGTTHTITFDVTIN